MFPCCALVVLFSASLCVLGFITSLLIWYLFNLLMLFSTSLLCALNLFWFLFKLLSPLLSFLVVVEEYFFVVSFSTTNLKEFFLGSLFISFFLFELLSMCMFYHCLRWRRRKRKQFLVSIFFDKVGFHFI